MGSAGFISSTVGFRVSGSGLKGAFETFGPESKEMIGYLSVVVPAFSQVVAVDMCLGYS